MKNYAKQWDKTTKKFLADTLAKEGIDYANDEDMRHELNAFIKILAENPRNNCWPMEKFLHEAHERVKVMQHFRIAA